MKAWRKEMNDALQLGGQATRVFRSLQVFGMPITFVTLVE